MITLSMQVHPMDDNIAGRKVKWMMPKWLWARYQWHSR